MKDLMKYGQYKNDIFNKLNFDFIAGKKLLDVGCGDCSDIEIFVNEFNLDVFGIDVFEHNNVKKIKNLKFKKAGIYNIPFLDNEFDYVFLHDVLHHIDEEEQSHIKHLKGLNELKRVTKNNGYIIILEGNRYNPLFYIHMVKMRGHNHWKQSYFKNTIKDVFTNVEFKYFECHAYPWGIKFWKIFEILMEKVFPKEFLAYNVTIIRNEK